MTRDIWNTVCDGDYPYTFAIPRESTLSYQWAQVAEKDRMYSSVFYDRVDVSGDARTIYSYTSRWLEARPIQDHPERFSITEIKYRTANFGTELKTKPVINDSGIRSRYGAVYVAVQRLDDAWEPKNTQPRSYPVDGTFSKREAEEFMRGYEAAMDGGRNNFFSSLYFSKTSIPRLDW